MLFVAPWTRATAAAWAGNAAWPVPSSEDESAPSSPILRPAESSSDADVFSLLVSLLLEDSVAALGSLDLSTETELSLAAETFGLSPLSFSTGPSPSTRCEAFASSAIGFSPSSSFEPVFILLFV